MQEPARMGIGRSMLVAVAVVLGVVAATVAFFGVAAVTDQVIVFALAAVGALLVVTTGVTALAVLGLTSSRSRSLRIGVPLITTVAVVFVASAILFNPLPFTSPGAQPAPGMRYWDVPTGSRLAHVKVAAVGTPHATPIIYLHGGPGAPELNGDLSYFGRLAQDGYDVYLYDQIGAGNSPRLADVTQYTVARHVADLEAVRQVIGADKVILIGQSWGSTLAAAYLVAYGEHVAKVVFSSPGPVWLNEVVTQGGASTGERLTPAQRNRVNDVATRPRAVLDQILFAENPRAAHAFAGDSEMDAYFDAVLDGSKAAAFCDVSHPPNLPTSGTGFYVNKETFADGVRVPDPRPALRAVQTPALILKGGCDYVAWHYATEYRDLLPNAQLVYLPNAGHKAYYDQTEAYFASLRAFLLDQAPPLAPYIGSNLPPDYTGVR